MDNNQTAARAARRLLDARIRCDWDWPNHPPPWSASDEELRGVSQFRERYYATTSSTSSSESESESGPYKFDSPDSVSAAVQSKAQGRKRKRKAILESEMTWNEGLACFVRRRDVWTGAATVQKHGTNGHPANSPPLVSAQEVASPSASGHASSSETSRETNPSSIPSVPFHEEEPVETLIPLPPPLLANNPIRDSITPKIYPEIYNKVVVSARTPSVPINLSDMTRALVQGWKDNGEWPPKSGPLDPLVGRKRSTLGKHSHSGTRDDGPFLAHHPHVKKGVESVKRIFHLSGNHANGTQHIGSAANGG